MHGWLREEREGERQEGRWGGRLWRRKSLVFPLSILYSYFQKKLEGEKICIWDKQISSWPISQLSMLIMVIQMNYPKWHTLRGPTSTQALPCVVLLLPGITEASSFDHSGFLQSGHRVAGSIHFSHSTAGLIWEPLQLQGLPQRQAQ